MAPDIATAKVARATLQAAGISCEIPDENMASLGWYLGNVIGGIRVQVAEAEFESAKALLATLEVQPLNDPDDLEEQRSAAADDKAMRAWRLAGLGFAMWPLFHPYALVIALRALKTPGLSAEGRQRARSAVRISVVSLMAFLCAIAATWIALRE